MSSMNPENLMAGPPPTLLPDDPAPRAELEAGADPKSVAAAHPTSSLAWAVLAEHALGSNDPVTAYAFARTGWKGHGPVPWEHGPNRGFLRALACLARSAHAIGEEEEYVRCRDFLRDSSVEASEVLAP
jgi:hypothetical protein